MKKNPKLSAREKALVRVVRFYLGQRALCDCNYDQIPPHDVDCMSRQFRAALRVKG